jgi:single-strand DNA-binding protein
VARFSVATSKNYKDQSGEWCENTTWHTVIAWRERAERAASSLNKGDLVYVEGEISNRKVEGENGPRFFSEIVASYFRIIKGRGGDGRMPSAEDEPPTFTTVGEAEARAAGAAIGGDGPARTFITDDDDLPF